jgi:lipopolysaccharide/colanic/teichoic acid biosynthesis glycosyltransferase
MWVGPLQQHRGLCLSLMLEFDARKFPIDAIKAARIALPPKALSAAALKVAAQPIVPAYSPIVLAGAVRLIELALTVLVGAALYALYVIPRDGFEWHYAIAILCIGVLTTLAFQVADIYQVEAFRGRERQYFRLATAWSVVFLLVIGASFFAKSGDQFSRVWLGSYHIVGLVSLLCFRRALFLLVRKWTREGHLERRTVIVGADANGDILVQSLAEQPDSDVRIIGMFDDRGDGRSQSSVGGHQKLGTVDDLVELARKTRIDLVLFSLPISAESRILQMLKKLWVLPVDIADKPITDWDVVMKWLFDRVIGGLALLCLSPVMMLVAIAIKLESRGPVFFKQKRYGFNNELIEVYKFRSMYLDQCDPTALKLVQKNDPRVTKVGAFIRKTSLDELPQLINVVFRGDLSLVGPRPHAVHAKAADRLYDEAVDGYFARHRVKPGITGWAQINGWRGETDTEEKIQRRVEHDLHYIENWSVLLDLAILARTPLALAKTEHAY